MRSTATSGSLDDDASTRDSLRLLLEAEGFEAREFAAGRAFLDIARLAEGDCLILDITMPRIERLRGFGRIAPPRR
jgi:FixJ family two-component response regulator